MVSSPWFIEPEFAIFDAPVIMMAIRVELEARAGEAALLVTSVYTTVPVPSRLSSISTYVSLLAVKTLEVTADIARKFVLTLIRPADIVAALVDPAASAVHNKPLDTKGRLPSVAGMLLRNRVTRSDRTKRLVVGPDACTPIR